MKELTIAMLNTKVNAISICLMGGILFNSGIVQLLYYSTTLENSRRLMHIAYFINAGLLPLAIYRITL